MNVCAHYEGLPLIRPLYYLNPNEEDAYKFPGEFWFGSELVVAPITVPRDELTLLGAVAAWLPPGDWVDFFSGRTYRGGRQLVLHRTTDTIPALARAGAIVPMTHPDSLEAGVENPRVLEIRVFAGASGEFTLIEDNNDDGVWFRTQFAFSQHAGTMCIKLLDGGRNAAADRSYRITFCGFLGLEAVWHNGVEMPVGCGPVPHSVYVSLSVLPDEGATLYLVGDLRLRTNDVRAECFQILDRAQLAYDLKDQIYAHLDGCLADAIAALEAVNLPVALRGALVEALTANASE